MINGWFPRLNRNGLVVSGAGEIFAAGKSYGPGHQGHWFSDTEFIFHNDSATYLCALNGTPRAIAARGYSTLAAGGGRWAGFIAAGNGEMFDSSRGTIPSACLPDINANGTLVHIAPYQASQRTLYRDHQPIAAALIEAARISDAGTITYGVFGPKREAWGIRGNAGPQQLCPCDSDVFLPVPIETPYGPFVLVFTHRDCRLYKWGSSEGLIVHAAPDTFNPDGIWFNGGFRVTWSTSRGELHVVDIPYAGGPLADISKISGWEKPKEPDKPIDPPVDPPKEPKGMFKNYREYLERRWNEERINERCRNNPDQSPEALFAIQVPWLIQVAGELYHDQGFKDVGLLFKDWGTHYNHDGFKVAVDILTVKETDERGNVVSDNFHIVDVIVAGGIPTSSIAWQDHGLRSEGDAGRYRTPPTPQTKEPDKEPDEKEPDMSPEVLAKLDEVKREIKETIERASAAEIAKLDELKVSVIRTSKELAAGLEKYLPLILAGGGLGGILGGGKKE